MWLRKSPVFPHKTVHSSTHSQTQPIARQDTLARENTDKTLASKKRKIAVSAGPGAAQPEMWRDIITTCFRPSGRNLKDHVDTYWSEAATFKTPMFTMKGKTDVYHLFHFWQNVFDDQIQVLDVAQQGDKVMVRIVHNLTLRPLKVVRPLIPDTLWKLINFPLVISATLNVDHSARGPRITGWYEDVSVYTLIYNILAYNKVVNVHDYIEYGLGKAMAIADEVGRQAYHLAAPYLMPVVDQGLRTVDGMSKQYLGVDTRLYHSSRNIWD